MSRDSAGIVASDAHILTWGIRLPELAVDEGNSGAPGMENMQAGIQA
jgi:hypothetical protein